MKNIYKAIFLFVPFLLFQSYGLGLLKWNVRIHNSFSASFMDFLRPQSLCQVWWNLPYLIYTPMEVFLIFFFARKVNLKSFEFCFVAAWTVMSCFLVGVGAMTRFHDAVIPIMLLVVFQKEHKYEKRN